MKLSGGVTCWGLLDCMFMVWLYSSRRTMERCADRVESRGNGRVALRLAMR